VRAADAAASLIPRVAVSRSTTPPGYPPSGACMITLCHKVRITLCGKRRLGNSQGRLSPKRAVLAPQSHAHAQPKWSPCV
jgi:hypothetical protein